MMNKKNFFPKLYPLDRDLSRTWYIAYRDSVGRPVKIYADINHYHTLGERLKAAEKAIQELLRPGSTRKPSSGLIGDLEAVLDYRRPRLEKKSYQTYLSYLVNFSIWWRKLKNEQADPAEYIQHLYQQGYHRNYILRIKIVLSSFFKELVKKVQYPVDPFCDIKIKRIKSRSLLPFSSYQVSLLKSIMLRKDPQLWEACLFQYYLFCRPKEIRLLKIENILFDSMQLAVDHTITKDDDVLLKAIPRPMQPIIERYRHFPPSWYVFGSAGGPGPEMLSRDALSKRHRKIMKANAFADRYAFYSWTHTGARDGIMSGIPSKQLQLQKGHSDLKMFDEYLKNIGVLECTQLIENFPAI